MSRAAEEQVLFMRGFACPKIKDLLKADFILEVWTPAHRIEILTHVEHPLHVALSVCGSAQTSTATLWTLSQIREGMRDKIRASIPWVSHLMTNLSNTCPKSQKNLAVSTVSRES